MDQDAVTLPPWNELKNEVGSEFNSFVIIRGKPFIKMGKDVWIGYFCLIDGSGGLTIGDNVTFASGVHVYTHDSSDFRAKNLPKDPENGTHIKRAPVCIGNNVQIGANSVVLPGVRIGNNVIIGALSLVNKDIPDNCVAVGSPVRIVENKTNVPFELVSKSMELVNALHMKESFRKLENMDANWKHE